MPQKPKAQYVARATQEISNFIDGTVIPAMSADAPSVAILDSVKNSPGVSLPPSLDRLIGSMDESQESRIFDSIRYGMEEYRAAHGELPTADVVEAAIQQGQSAFHGINAQGMVLDAATSTNSDPQSLQPNRAVVAILSAIAEAIPFAAYLPVDIKSNQAKLAILSHRAANDFGDYTSNEIMDGVNAGDVYTSSSRWVKLDVSGAAPYNSKFTPTNLSTAGNEGFCNPAGSSMPVLRGRTIVYVNGKIAATDYGSNSGSAANSPVTGTVVIGGVTYSLVGYVTVATGAFQLTSVTPSFPANTEVVAQAFIDFETSPSLIPGVQVRADVYDLFANPWRVKTSIGIDSNTQLANELGLDGNSEALMAIRSQMAMERHYKALGMASRLGKNNEVTHDFNFSNQSLQKTRAQMWQDVAPTLGAADQQMANLTMDHGITHVYCGAFAASSLYSLPTDLFVPSGVPVRPGIYRLGRLFNKYEMYYSPKGPTESGTTSTMIAIGRSTQVGRCPIVLGDAVSPTYLPLARNSDLADNSAMYARDFTSVNPHEPSALGCARITLNNIK